MAPTDPVDLSKQKRLVLCFDGTGNKFLGNESDTNIVKIYQMLDRNCGDQYHYYQPGIGTYVQNQDSNSTSGGLISRIKSFFTTSKDQAVGTSFVHHVLSGYQFIMRYFSPGDCIYIFGFSRGAYTARFLSEMVHTIGLLSKGNEEMVHFAWDTFSDFQKSRGNDPWTATDHARQVFMVKFKETFCRPNVNVHFLGLFDCVNSVGSFEIPLFRKSYQYMSIPPATHIRHAISIHERRLKFKPALFLVDEKQNHHSNIKEVWFAGNHGDVGGGWGLAENQKHLLSDTPLTWMVDEVKNLENTPNKLQFQTTVTERNERGETTVVNQLNAGIKQLKLTNREQRILSNRPHDMLGWGRGASWLGTFGWWLIETIPIFTRLELENGSWNPRYWPPNMGARRDIPLGATIHPSVEAMFKAGVLTEHEMPKLGGDGPPILLTSSAIKAWTNLRNSKASLGSKQPLLANGHAPESTATKKWDGIGTVGYKDWSWE